MNRRDIQELRIHVGHPAITLIMPCNKENIRTKFLQMLAEAGGNELVSISLASEFDSMFEKLTCPTSGGTVAIFVNKYIARFYFLPCIIEEVATCGQTFKLDVISAALNRLQRYWVVDCIVEPKELYEGAGEYLITVNRAHAGMDSPDNPYKKTVRFDEYLDQDRLPICCLIEPKNKELYLESCEFRDRVVVTVQDFSHAWPAMQTYFKEEQARVLHELKQGEEGTTYVTGLQSVLKAARQGAVTTLLVEQNYHLDACEEQVTRQVVTQEALCPVGYQKVALIDQIIESVRSKGGAVFLVPDGTLTDYERLVALIRFVA